MKHGVVIVDDERFLNYIQESKDRGMTEKEIATSLGMTLSEMRLNRTNCQRKRLGLEPFPPNRKGSLIKKGETT